MPGKHVHFGRDDSPYIDFEVPLEGEKVTIRRLYPVLEGLLKNHHESKEHPDNTDRPMTHLTEELRSELNRYVSNNMPIRLLQIPEMELLERHAVAEHIALKMCGVNDALLKNMMEAVWELGKPSYSHGTFEFEEYERHVAEWDGTEQEKDAREDPWEAVCQFLFFKYAGYAILSHTWLQGADREITRYDSLGDDWWKTAPKGPGHAKLEGFTSVAFQNGATLCWIDTLCINKDSSSELDESIRSMYRWYRTASLCIVYLRDTTSLDTFETDGWFKRGWTLQELLAPARIKFYTSDWIQVIPDNSEDQVIPPLPPSYDSSSNDKTNPMVQVIIQKVTRIGPSELTSFNPINGSSVATRMSWAADRITTRDEDRAYSLMGIFGVSFTTSYGEGLARAFFRLIEAIITTRPTPYVIEMLAWAGPAIPKTVHTSRLIPSSPECYTPNGYIPASNHESTADISTYSASAPEPMMLTHLGLKIKLLILFTTSCTVLPIVHPDQNLGPYNVELKIFPHAKSSFLPLTIPLQKMSLRRSGLTISAICGASRSESFYGHNVALGIYTYNENEEEGLVYIPLHPQAFLLAFRDQTGSIESIESRHFSFTSKIDTQEIVQLHREYHLEPTEHVIMTEELNDHGMKLLSLYL